MEKDDILNAVKDILVEEVRLTSNKDSIKNDSNLKNDFNINSMQMVTFLVELEKKFNIEMDSEEITQDIIINMDLLIKFIERTI